LFIYVIVIFLLRNFILIWSSWIFNYSPRRF